MKYIVDKLPTRPVDCPFYGLGGACDFEHGYPCEYFNAGEPSKDENDCLGFRTFRMQLFREFPKEVKL